MNSPYVISIKFSQVVKLTAYKTVTVNMRKLKKKKKKRKVQRRKFKIIASIRIFLMFNIHFRQTMMMILIFTNQSDILMNKYKAQANPLI
jgi:hypothetical protein